MESGNRRNRDGWRRALHVAAWNAALLACGLALIAAAGEIWLRATRPFPGWSTPLHLVPDIGYVYRPGAEIHRTNHLDFWTVSRTNSLGFADREPAAERAADGCRVMMIGDSFVAALQVPVADKLHVRLEALARRELPHLDIRATAFGQGGFAPVNELAFWDRHARRLRPRLLVLVLSVNDLWGNSSLLRGLESGWDPDRLPFVTARRAADGTITLLPPDPDPAPWWEIVPPASMPWTVRADRLLERYESWYLPARLRHELRRWSQPDRRQAWARALLPRRRHAAHVDTLLGIRRTWEDVVREAAPPPVFREALALAGFAFDQFAERTRRDGTALVILATRTLGGGDDPAFGRVRALAEPRGIPVINQHDYIVSRGGDVSDTYWRRDGHWNPAGHRWAAEALLEHLRRNPRICDPRV